MKLGVQLPEKRISGGPDGGVAISVKPMSLVRTQARKFTSALEQETDPLDEQVAFWLSVC